MAAVDRVIIFGRDLERTDGTTLEFPFELSRRTDMSQVIALAVNGQRREMRTRDEVLGVIREVAAQLRRADPSLAQEQAEALALQQNPALYEAHEELPAGPVALNAPSEGDARVGQRTPTASEKVAYDFIATRTTEIQRALPTLSRVEAEAMAWAENPNMYQVIDDAVTQGDLKSGRY